MSSKFQTFMNGDYLYSADNISAHIIGCYIDPWFQDKLIIPDKTFDNNGEEYLVTGIGASAFDGVNATSFIIPKSITYIGPDVFRSTLYREKSSNWDEDSALYADNCLIEVDLDCPENFIVRPGTRLIAERAFDNCKIKTLNIPRTCQSINLNPSIDKTVLIKCPANSYAARWAEKNGNPIEYTHSKLSQFINSQAAQIIDKY